VEKIMPTVFHTFPREVGWYRRDCQSMETLLKYLNEGNGYEDCYVSIYRIPEFRNYESIELDKVYFDLDSDTCWQDLQTLREYYLKRNVLHYCLFSGRGYHLYALLRPMEYHSKKSALYNYHIYMRDKLGINICDKCLGNISKISRYPNTWNIKRKRFCIPLGDKTIDLSYEEHCELAKKQRWNGNFFGSKLERKVKEFDREIKIPEPKEAGDIILGKEYEDIKQKCIRFILSKNCPSHDERVVLVAFLSDLLRLGDPLEEYDKDEITKQIVSFLRRLNWLDYSETMTQKQTKYVVENCPRPYSCMKLKSMGLCINGCEMAENG